MMKGFTFTELIIAMAIFATLVLIGTLSLLNVKQQASLQTSVNVFVTDLKQQQLKAMVGDTTSPSATRSDYGIHLGTTSYVLFKGNSYNPASTQNFTIQLGDNISFLSTGNVIFSRRNGELTGGATTIILQEGTTGTQRTISLNAYGIITAVN